jgi:subtilisin family serine protease
MASKQNRLQEKILMNIFKFKSLFLSATLLFSICSYRVNDATATTYDVARAKGPVKFTFSLTESISFIGANIPYDLNYKGQDSYVAVIDTGVDSSHPFLQGRVALEACFAAKCPNGTTSMIGTGAAKPVHWHGTHVAGIIAGSNSGFHGVAPQAKIIAINVFDSSGAAYDNDIIKALNWVNSISSQYNITSINMSLGGASNFTTSCDAYIPEMTSAIKSLKDLNIATVIASGNNYAYGMSAPACISHSVSVAAVYTNTSSITDFSNVNKYTTLSAPGFRITSSSSGTAYQSASGTSMATPHVAGAFAVYRSKFGIQSVDKVVSDFKSASKTSKDAYTNLSVPRLDFTSMFADTPVSTTTIPSTTTTLPVVSTTTTTTLPTTTSTTLPVVTTTSTTSTTTTLPPPVTTSTTTTVVPPPLTLPRIPKPILLDLNGLYKTFVWVKYRDPYQNKQFITHYELFCNNLNTYTIPKQDVYSFHSYKLLVPASAIDYCQFYGITIYGTKTAYSTRINIYPKNKPIIKSIKTVQFSTKCNPKLSKCKKK